jgi:hypothetical protein
LQHSDRRQALSYAQARTSSKVAHEYLIFAATYGLLFFGTPHAGSDKAVWLSYANKLSTLVLTQSTDGFKNGLVDALRSESETLQIISEMFIPIKSNFRIYYFWEQEMTKLPLGRKDYIVAPSSAAPMDDEAERCGIAANHSKMNRFDDPSSNEFRRVIDAIVRYAAEAKEVIPARMEEVEDLLQRARRREIAELQRRAGIL